MNLGEVLSQAWKIIWKHKVLWIFGILASCSGANGSIGNVQSTYRGEAPPQLERLIDQFARLPEWQIALIVGIILLIFLILIVISIFLSTIGRIGLIRGTVQVEQGLEKLSFGELFSGSIPFFLRIFGLNLLVGLLGFLAALILIAPFIVLTIATFGVGALCLLPLFCVFIPMAWFIGIIVEQANIAIVSENLGILAGLKRGWDIVRNNLGAVILMALILYVGISLIAGFIIGLPLIFLVGPFVVGALSGTERALQGGALISVLCFIGYLPILLILSGILSAYIQSAWTLTFLRLRSKPIIAKPQAE